MVRATTSIPPLPCGTRVFSSITKNRRSLLDHAPNTAAAATAMSSSRPRPRPGPSHCHLHTSPPTLHKPPRQRDLFTPSPFGRSSKINIGDHFVIHRETKEGKDPYGARSYFLLPRSALEDDVDFHVEEWNPRQKKRAIASIHADKNILFGAKLHIASNGTVEHGNIGNQGESDSYASDYLSACGPLLDIAKEDASVNGQQPQALAALNGLCAWVKERLEKNGEGSEVLTNLMHGSQYNYLLDGHDNDANKHAKADVSDNNQNDNHQNNNNDDNMNNITNNTNKYSKTKQNKNPRSKIQDRTTTPTGNTPTHSAKFLLQNESERIFLLDAVRAIATGIPRPGHSVVGAGTYRDGKEAWMTLAWEYCALVDGVRDGGWASGEGATCAWRGLEEVLLYKSRDGEVSLVEHLAHTHPDYLKDAGGAMARLFFV